MTKHETICNKMMDEKANQTWLGLTLAQALGLGDRWVCSESLVSDTSLTLITTIFKYTSIIHH